VSVGRGFTFSTQVRPARCRQLRLAVPSRWPARTRRARPKPLPWSRCSII